MDGIDARKAALPWVVAIGAALGGSACSRRISIIRSPQPPPFLNSIAVTPRVPFRSAASQSQHLLAANVTFSSQRHLFRQIETFADARLSNRLAHLIKTGRRPPAGDLGSVDQSYYTSNKIRGNPLVTFCSEVNSVPLVQRGWHDCVLEHNDFDISGSQVLRNGGDICCALLFRSKKAKIVTPGLHYHHKSAGWYGGIKTPQHTTCRVEAFSRVCNLHIIASRLQH